MGLILKAESAGCAIYEMWNGRKGTKQWMTRVWVEHLGRWWLVFKDMKRAGSQYPEFSLRYGKFECLVKHSSISSGNQSTNDTSLECKDNVWAESELGAHQHGNGRRKDHRGRSLGQKPEEVQCVE